jgi:hypothetical protein
LALRHQDACRSHPSRAAPSTLVEVVPWEKIVVPHEVDGSLGLHRAPRASCVLRANSDYEVVQAWLSLHEAPATLSSYRKEVERLILWAIVEGAWRCHRWPRKMRWHTRSGERSRPCVVTGGGWSKRVNLC